MGFATHDLAGDVTPGAMRQRHTRNTPPLPEIEMIEGAGPHSDQHFTRPGLWVRHHLMAKHRDPTVFVEPYGFHLLISLYASARSGSPRFSTRRPRAIWSAGPTITATARSACRWTVAAVVTAVASTASTCATNRS